MHRLAFRPKSGNSAPNEVADGFQATEESATGCLVTRTTETDEPELVEPVIVPGGTVRPADGAFQEPEGNGAQA